MSKNFYHFAVLGAECSGKSTFLRKTLASSYFFSNFLTSLNLHQSQDKNAQNLHLLEKKIEESITKGNLKIKKTIFFEGVRRFVYQNQRAPLNHQEQFVIATEMLKLYFLQKECNKNHNPNIVNICFSDTTPLLTALYSDYYLSSSKNFKGMDEKKDMRLWHLALNLHLHQNNDRNHYDAILLFSPNIPWASDEPMRKNFDATSQATPIHMRDGDIARQAIFKELVACLDEFGLSYFLI